MANFTARKLLPADLPELRNLFSTRNDTDRLDPDQRLNMVSRVAFSNPLAKEEATYFVIDDKDQLIAHVGRMPMRVTVFGQEKKAFFVHDLYVRPDYRSSGMGLFISMALYDVTSDQSDSFCWLLWPSHLNLDLLRRYGYFETYANGFVKILKFEYIVRRLGVRPLIAKAVSVVPNLLIRLVDGIVMRTSGGSCRVVAIDRFDHRFDELNDRVGLKFGLISSRRADVLNWKYANFPGRHCSSFAAVRGEVVEGFVVLEVRDTGDNSGRAGLILEALADPADSSTLSTLLAFTVSYFRDRQVERIRCVAAGDEYASILKRHLFLSRKSWRVPVMLGNLETCLRMKRVLTDRTKWHISLGDSDGFMFME